MYAQLGFKQAEFDLKAAEDSSKDENYEWACFQAQQSVEKALKAFLFLNRKRNIITHSIKSLIEKAMEINNKFQILKKAKILDQYYIPTRYPNGLPDDVPHLFFVKEDAQLCVKYARKIICMVGILLKNQP